MNGERRKNYKWGITPGEWMQAGTVIAVILIATLSFYVRAEQKFNQVDRNEIDITEINQQQTQAIRNLKSELKEDIRNSEARTRRVIENVGENVRELTRTIIERSEHNK